MGDAFIKERTWLHHLRSRLSQDTPPSARPYFCSSEWAWSLSDEEAPLPRKEELTGLLIGKGGELRQDPSHLRRWLFDCIEHVLILYEWDRIIAKNDSSYPPDDPEDLRRDLRQLREGGDTLETPAVEDAAGWANYSVTGSVGWAVYALNKGDWLKAASNCRAAAEGAARMATWDSFPPEQDKARGLSSEEAARLAEGFELRWQIKRLMSGR